LDFAHARGLIHRDVKPGNVLLKKDGAGYVVKLVDFGIAHAQEEAGGTRLTKTGMIVGSAEYMSPEQGGSGAKVDHRSDVYSLGIVAYEMLCGQPPFPGSGDVSVITVIMQHVRDEPPAPITLLPSLPKVANSAILKALAKNPEERFASCAAFLQALAGNVVVGPPRGKKGGASGKSKFPLVPVALGTLVFLGAGLIGYALMPKGPDIEEVSLNPAATTTVAGGTSPTEPSEDSSTEPPTPKVVTVSVPVPIVVSKTEAQASEILKANSLVPQVTTGYSEAFSQGQVMSQYPSVGTEVGKGAPVKIRISLGPNVAEQKRREEAARLREERAEETRAEREAEAADTQAILQAVDAHHDAWERLDVDAYMSGYSTDARIFNNKKWSSYDEHYQHEREMFARGGSIELTRKPASVDINGDRATVSFRSTFQRWGGKGNFKTSGLQKFIMRKVDGRWLIEEDVFKRQK
jgi:serine/threonine-protein kinase